MIIPNGICRKIGKLHATTYKSETIAKAAIEAKVAPLMIFFVGKNSLKQKTTNIAINHEKSGTAHFFKKMTISTIFINCFA